jgi:nitrogen regulatory protein PII-like uncharacterized protein
MNKKARKENIKRYELERYAIEKGANMKNKKDGLKMEGLDDSKKLFRVHTENKNQGGIVSILRDAGFEGFTVYRVAGFWRGVFERSLCIEILGYAYQKDAVLSVCQAIQEKNRQEAVLMVTLNADFNLIENSKTGV